MPEHIIYNIALCIHVQTEVTILSLCLAANKCSFHSEEFVIIDCYFFPHVIHVHVIPSALLHITLRFYRYAAY